MNVAVIPARGGSKRIPRKNVRPFLGVPIIAYSIEAARESGCFDRIIVSTDDEEIAAVARSYGAETPFLRPALLADDYASTSAVMKHALEWMCCDGGEVPSRACCIYATAPFIQAQDIRAGLDMLIESAAAYVFTITNYAFPVQRAVRISKIGRIEMLQPEYFSVRSQDLEEVFHDAGQFYWGTARAWCEERPIFSSDALPLQLPRHRVQDIDTPEDWLRAEWMFRAMSE